MPAEYIINVNELDFEYEVIAYSKQVPVIADFWAEWCGPCKMLGPILERLTEEAQGSFRLAKVNVDDNPNLALQYGVRSIPLVKAFRDGQVVSEIVGAQPEPRIREFIRSIAPSQTDLTLERALSELNEHQWSQAEESFRDFLNVNPGNPAGLLGLAKSTLMRGNISEALSLLNKIPPSKEFSAAEVLKPLANVLENIDRETSSEEDYLFAAYKNSLRLILKENYAAAMDGLLDILRQNKNYRDGEVKRIMLSLFEILGNEQEISRQYRNEFASVIF